MTTFNKYAFSAVVLGYMMNSNASAFTPVSNVKTSQRASSMQRMVATTPADIGVGGSIPSFNQNDNNDDENKRTGAMIDLEGIAFSVSIHKCADVISSKYSPVGTKSHLLYCHCL